MTERSLGLVLRAMERMQSQGFDSALGPEASAAAAPPMAEPMRAMPELRAGRSEPLLPRLRFAMMWSVALGCLVLMLSTGGAFIVLSGKQNPISAVPPAAAAPPAAPATVTAEAPRTAPPQGDDLVALGNEQLWNGDIATARLYFERAAETGNAHAVFLVGETYDTPLLAKLGVRGMRGDSEEAARWYRRARDLGDSEAAEHLSGPGAPK